MKVFKIILAIAVLAVLGYLIWDSQIPSHTVLESSNESHDIDDNALPNDSGVTKKSSTDDLEIVKTFEDEFWDLVKKNGNAKKDEYTQLYNKHNVSSQHPIKSFLKEITLTSANFKPFRNILDLTRRNTANNKDINDLIRLYKEQKK